MCVAFERRVRSMDSMQVSFKASGSLLTRVL